MRGVCVLIGLLGVCAAWPHPGNGIAVLDSDSVLVSDSVNNVVWRFERGKRPTALVRRIHCHYLVKGEDGKYYVEALQERGGAHATAIFSIDPRTGRLAELPFTRDLPSGPFAIDGKGRVVMPGPKGFRRLERGGSWADLGPFGSVGTTPVTRENLEALAWGNGEFLYYSDGPRVIRFHPDRGSELVYELGDRTAPALWNRLEQGARPWGLAMDGEAVVAAVAATGAVLRLESSSTKVLHRSNPGWVPTGVSVHGRDVYIVETRLDLRSGPRLAVLRNGKDLEPWGTADKQPSPSRRYGWQPVRLQ